MQTNQFIVTFNTSFQFFFLVRMAEGEIDMVNAAGEWRLHWPDIPHHRSGKIIRCPHYEHALKGPRKGLRHIPQDD
jgi:hypothetical protein